MTMTNHSRLGIMDEAAYEKMVPRYLCEKASAIEARE